MHVATLPVPRDARPVSDGDARGALARGDRAAVTAFYREHLDAVYAFVLWRVGGDRADAEDVTQETFVTALRAVREFRGDSALRTWLLGIAKNKAHEKLRERGRLEATPDEALARALGSLDAVALLDEVARAEETRRLVAATMAALPAHYRKALEDKYVTGRSLAEMAEAEARSAKAVESTVQRARVAFAETLRRLCGAGDAP